MGLVLLAKYFGNQWWNQKKKWKNIQFLALISVCVSSDQREWELYLGWNLNFTLFCWVFYLCLGEILPLYYNCEWRRLDPNSDGFGSPIRFAQGWPSSKGSAYICNHFMLIIMQLILSFHPAASSLRTIDYRLFVTLLQVCRVCN